MAPRKFMLVAAAVLAIAGCGGSDGGELDPTPQKQSGEESTEFETEDIEAAEDAGRLVEVYCGGIPSEAQRIGCLSHVSKGDICAQDTEGRRFAVEAYIEKTGDDAICD